MARSGTPAVTRERIPSFRQAIARLTYEAQMVLSQHPAVALPIARARGHGVVAGADTEIVIEGFPRSANAFAVAAFARAQRPHRARIAHHVHAPAQVLAAVRRGTPALVLIRRPEDCVLEYALKKRDVTLGQALRGYARFYAPLLPYRSGFVIGLFDEVITDFGSVVRRINQRFEAGFREFEHTDESARACLEEIDAYWRDRLGPGEALEITVNRPSEVRDLMKDTLRPAYHSTPLAEGRARAERLYEAFVLAARQA